nr:hypothetical protein [Leptospira alexanderi]
MQLDFVATLDKLKKLRITHVRPKTIDFLIKLQNVEELVLEYVSGFESVGPIGELKNLKALHIENFRKIQGNHQLLTNSSQNLQTFKKRGR